jgi:DNA invertase Pin-like site-specific DNA recombinase
MQSPAFPPPGSRVLSWAGVSTAEQAKSERESLRSQKADNEAAAARFGWQIVAHLEVPGFSRGYLDLREFADDAAAQGINAGLQLIEYLEGRKAFDVFMCRDADRFGRTMSLVTRISEDILYRLNKHIYTTANGQLIGRGGGGNFWMAMKSMEARGEVDRLVARRAMGVSGRVKRGLMSGDIPATHKLIRDDKGRGTHLELVPEWVEIMHRAADLLLSGIATSGNLEPQLFKLYGIGEANKPFRRYYIMKRFFNPLTYGNTYTGHIVRATEPSLWFAEPGHAQPADLKEIHYNTTVAVFTGDLRRRVLDYLSDFIQNRAGAGNKARSWHAGLVVCAECGYAANVRSATNHPPHVYRYLACSTVTRAKDNMPGERECSNRTFLREDTLQEYVNILLKRMIEAQSLALVTQALGDVDTSALLATANARVDELSAKLKALLVDRAVATGIIRALYDEQYAELAAELDDAETQRNQYVSHQRPPDTRQQEAALSLITRLTLDAFWQQEPGVIRQTLRELLGGLRFAIEGGRVVGLTRFRR